MWNRRFIFLWGGQTLANLGDVFYIVAFISAVYAVTDSVMYTSLIPVMNLTAQSAGALTAPFVFRRLSLPQMLVVSQGSKTLFLAAAVLVVPLAEDRGPQLVSALLAVGAAIAFMDGWSNPARNSLVPQVVPRSELMRANGLLATSDQTAFFAGWALGGVLVAWIGSGLVISGTVAAYLVSTLAMLGVAPDAGRERAQPKAVAGNPSLLTGWRFIRTNPKVRFVVTVDAVIGLANAVWIAAIMLPFAVQELEKGEEWWGYINAGYLLGAIIGGILLLAKAQRMQKHLPQWIMAGIIGSAVVTVGFGSSTHPLLALFFSFALGPLYEVHAISKQTLLQQATPEERLPYVLSAKGTVDTMVFGISALVMGALAEWLGTRTVYFLSAGILCVAVLFAWHFRRLQYQHTECEYGSYGSNDHV